MLAMTDGLQTAAGGFHTLMSILRLYIYIYISERKELLENTIKTIKSVFNQTLKIGDRKPETLSIVSKSNILYLDSYHLHMDSCLVFSKKETLKETDISNSAGINLANWWDLSE